MIELIGIVVVAFMPLVFLWIGWNIMNRKFPAVRLITRYLKVILRYLWQRPKKSGGAKVKSPKYKYYE